MTRALAPVLAGLLLVPVMACIPGPPQLTVRTAPETFRGYARVTAADASGGGYVTIKVERYSAASDIEAMEQALKSGSAAFLEALRRAPVVGTFEFGGQAFDIRWARETRSDAGRVVSFVTDKPVYFVGGAAPDAKARAGYDVGVVQLTLSTSNVGEGIMAAAARVKPGGPTGVEIEDYATAPIKLTSVIRGM